MGSAADLHEHAAGGEAGEQEHQEREPADPEDAEREMDVKRDPRGNVDPGAQGAVKN